MTNTTTPDRHPFFGRDPDSYNIDLDEGDDGPDGSGRPGLGIVFTALQFWVGQQEQRPTVSDAARVFSMPPEAVAYCVEHGPPWLFLGGEDTGGSPNQRTIEEDGE